MTMRRRLLRLLSGTLLLALRCDGVLIGDEQFGSIRGGAFWTFHSRGVSIVNPLSCQIEHTFHQDALGDALPRTWRKGVYMQRDAPSQWHDDDVPLTATPELLPRKDAYVFINSGENMGDGENAEVLVFDTTTSHQEPVLRRIEVGGDLGNAYALHNRNQVCKSIREDIFIWAGQFVFLFCGIFLSSIWSYFLGFWNYFCGFLG
jgi:hypothetical protein